MEEKKIKVLICDDMEYLCDFFELLINSTDRLSCCGKAHNESESLMLTKKTLPDIILLDVQMDTQYSGLNIMSELLEISPESKMIIISVHEDKEMIFNAISKGAKDYLLKNQSSEEIIKKIEDVYDNKNHMDSNIIQKLTKQYAEIEQRQSSLLYMFNEMMLLSKKELGILRDLYNGKTYEQIAKEQFVEDVTIRTHVHRILKKLKFQNLHTLLDELHKLQVFEFFK